MALQYVKPDTSSNPLNERKLSLQEADDLGYVIPIELYNYSNLNEIKSQTDGGIKPMPESFWQSNFDTNMSKLNYYLTGTNAGTIGAYNYFLGLKQNAIKGIEKRTQAIKSQTGRDVGRSKAIIQRLARASGGLLAGSASPSLDGGKGLPDLGTETPQLSKATSKIGTKAKI